MRPSSAIRSRRLRDSTTASTVGWDSVTGLGSAAMLDLLLPNRVDASFGAGLAQQFLILDHFL